MSTPKKKRKCLSCGKVFKPMTDNVWKQIERVHKRSLVHKKRVRQKSRKS